MNYIDTVSGLFWIGVSLFVCILSASMGIGSFSSPAAGFLPFWAGVILGVSGLVQTLVSIGKREAERIILSRLWSGVEWVKVILVLVSLFMYIVLLPKLGYLLSTFGFLTYLFSLRVKSRIWAQALLAFLMALLTYFIFAYWLDVKFPKGIFGF